MTNVTIPRDFTITMVKTRWRLKSCPRCRGDFFLDTDPDMNRGWHCLQCGYLKPLEDQPVLHYAGKRISKNADLVTESPLQ